MRDDDESWLVVDTAPFSPARTRYRRDLEVGSPTSPDPASARIVWVVGEIDIATAPVLAAGLDQALTGRVGVVVVDCSGVAFCGARGLSLLAEAVSRGAEQGTAVTVVGLPARLLEVSRSWSEPLGTRSPGSSSGSGAQDGTAWV